MTSRLPLFVVRDLVTGRQSPFTPPQRLVALCIAHRMNEAGEAWPSVQSISEWTALGERTVRAALQTLAAEGGPLEVARGGARVGARYATNTYRLREGCSTGTPGKGEGGNGCTPQGVQEMPAVQEMPLL